jgi:DNA-binding LacI/PurR family transcriptional regulator/DNA-binding MarR family transcriptional regulator
METSEQQSGIADLSDPRLSAIRSLRNLIESGALRAGEPIPSERDLARQIRVARTTVRAALTELERIGMISPARVRARRTVVYRTASDAGGVMSRTLAMLSDARIETWERQSPSPGWNVYVQLHTAALAHDRGLHVLTLHPDSLGVSDIERLAAQKPLSLVSALYRVGESERGRRILGMCRQRGIVTSVYGESAELSEHDRVGSDHAAGSAELVRFLVSRGRRRILRVWRCEGTDERRGASAVQPPTWLSQRDEGYDRACAELGLTALKAVRIPTLAFAADMPPKCNAETFGEVVRATAGYLIEAFKGGEKPDGVMVVTDRHAYQVTAALRLLGMTPGVDVEVVGYDHTFEGDPDRAFEASGPVATMDKDNKGIAEALVGLSMDRAAGALPAEPQVRLVTPKLVVPG